MDKYSKLRPQSSTHTTDICKCHERPPIMLQYHLSSNPLTCVDCNLEVDLNLLNLSQEIIEDIVKWRDFFYCFYYLWLDSQEFENWAKSQLSLPNTPVNKRGLELKERIKNENIECYYWWFVDNSTSDFVPINECPNCCGPIIERKNKLSFNTKLCIKCGIIIAE